MGTQEDRKTGEWKDPVKRKAVRDRQIRLLMSLRYEYEGKKVPKSLIPGCQEKLLSR